MFILDCENDKIVYNEIIEIKEFLFLNTQKALFNFFIQHKKFNFTIEIKTKGCLEFICHDFKVAESSFLIINKPTKSIKKPLSCKEVFYETDKYFYTVFVYFEGYCNLNKVTLQITRTENN